MLEFVSKHKNELVSRQGDFIVIRNFVINSEGTAGIDTQIKGISKTHIENTTPFLQTYIVSSLFCVYDQPCVLRTVQIQLDPSGYVILDKSPTALYKFEKPGKYHVSLYTYVARENLLTQFAGYAIGKINIS